MDKGSDWTDLAPVYSGSAVVRHYYDHLKQHYRQQTLTQEEMIGRYISHIPAKHFKMVRYYGFFSKP